VRMRRCRVLCRPSACPSTCVQYLRATGARESGGRHCPACASALPGVGTACERGRGVLARARAAQALITVSNHVAALDDPLVLCRRCCRRARWAARPRCAGRCARPTAASARAPRPPSSAPARRARWSLLSTGLGLGLGTGVGARARGHVRVLAPAGVRGAAAMRGGSITYARWCMRRAARLCPAYGKAPGVGPPSRQRHGRRFGVPRRCRRGRGCGAAGHCRGRPRGQA